MNDEDDRILQRVSALQREMDSLYAATLDTKNPRLVAVSSEISGLLVEYLRRQSFIAQPPESLPHD
jgi:hypothetical protein